MVQRPLKRKALRLKSFDYSKPGAYFVTICTENRKCVLENIVAGKIKLTTVGEIVKKYWLKLPEKFENIRVDEYVIMPNHIHGIIVIEKYDCEPGNVVAIHELPLQKKRRMMLIPRAIGFLKMNSSKQINRKMKLSNIFQWQRNYYEHIIRDEEDLNEIRKYIINNPLQWELDKENPKNIRG
jgi:putative transposase